MQPLCRPHDHESARCYELKRFGGSYEAMFAQILEWNRPDP
jgi:hypothetical protein